MAQLIEHLPNKCEALSSDPSTTKKALKFRACYGNRNVGSCIGGLRSDARQGTNMRPYLKNNKWAHDKVVEHLPSQPRP
jgi:hypothetical protein